MSLLKRYKRARYKRSPAKRWVEATLTSIRVGDCNGAVRSALAAAKRGVPDKELRRMTKALRRCSCRIKRGK